MDKTENNNDNEKELTEHKDAYRSTLQQKKFGSPSPQDIARDAECLHQNLFRPKLTVGWLKEQCRLNGKSFSGRFKHFMGRYPKNYILYHRIEVGKILLTKTNATLSIVSFGLGFTRYSTFCKAFKRQTGKTPKKWREEKQKE